MKTRTFVVPRWFYLLADVVTIACFVGTTVSASAHDKAGTALFVLSALACIGMRRRMQIGGTR